MGELLSRFGEKTVVQVGLARLKSRCEIWRRQTVRSAYGGVSTEKWLCLGNFACDIEPVDKPDEELVSGFAGESEYLVYLPCEAQLDPSDRIVSPGVVEAWKPNAAYAVGALCASQTVFGNADGALTNNHARLFTCVGAGVSGTNNPFSKPVTFIGDVFADGPVFWRATDEITILEIVDAVGTASELREGRVRRVRAKMVR